MAKAIRNMKSRMNNVDVVVEIRDARLPLTSINPIFQGLFQVAPANGTCNPTSLEPNNPIHLVVYNKRDLADQHLEKPLKDAFLKLGQAVFFTNSRIDQDAEQILRQSKGT